MRSDESIDVESAVGRGDLHDAVLDAPRHPCPDHRHAKQQDDRRDNAELLGKAQLGPPSRQVHSCPSLLAQRADTHARNSPHAPTQFARRRGAEFEYGRKVGRCKCKIDIVGRNSPKEVFARRQHCPDTALLRMKGDCIIYFGNIGYCPELLSHLPLDRSQRQHFKIF